RPRPTARRDVTPVARLYEKALARLARRGLPRQPSETPREFAARVARENVRGSDALARLTELYAAARFGRHPPAEGELDELGARPPATGEAAADTTTKSAAA